MSSLRILHRTLGLEFYRQNSGFFIVLLAIALVFLDGTAHYHLMMAGLHNSGVLLVFMILWLLYWLKTIHYTWTALREKQNQFLYQLYLYPHRRQYNLLGLVHLEQFSPVILYAGLLSWLGFANDLYRSAALCLLFLGLMLVFSSLLYGYFIRSAGKEIPWLGTPDQLSRRMRKPAWSLPLYFLLHQQKLALFLSKACTCLLILLVAFLYTRTNYDSRLATMCICIAALGNAVLIYHIHTFKHINLSLQRNMPIPLYKRFMNSAACLLLLAIPEILFFSRHFYVVFDVFFMLQAAFLFFSIILLLNSYLLRKSLQKEVFLLHTVFSLVGYYLITIYHTPPWFIATAGLLMAFMLFVRYYYRFEPGLGLKEE